MVLVISASLALTIPVAGALLLVGAARALWSRLIGRRPPPFAGATFRTIQIDGAGLGGQGGPGPPADDQGPVVDALPRKPSPPGMDGPVA
jgi:hypothetical protein